MGILSLSLLASASFVALVWLATHEANRSARRALTLKAAFGAGAWLALSGGLALAGVWSRFDWRPPPIVGLLVVSVLLGVVVGGSRLGGRIAANVPLWSLVLAQGFRLPLELVMHRAAVERVMPVQLSFSGFNFDIVTGASALLLGGLLYVDQAPRWLVVVWNYYGVAALMMIALIAVLTSPFVHAFGPESVNTWVASFPYVWLPAACVSFAVAGHVMVFRAVRGKR